MASELEIMNQYYTIEIILKLYQIGIRFELGDGEIVGWREETHGKNLLEIITNSDKIKSSQIFVQYVWKLSL